MMPRKKRLHRVVAHFGHGSVQRRQTDQALGEHVLLGAHHDHDGQQRADEVAHIDDSPVAPHPEGADFAGGPCHHDQVVAGEQLGARHDNQDQAEAEGKAGQQPRHAVG
jgi:hypothetical protein